MTVKVHDALLSEVSSTMQVTAVSPDGKVEPEGLSHVTDTTATSSSDSVSKVATTPAALVAAIVWLEGHVMVGAMVSAAGIFLTRLRRLSQCVRGVNTLAMPVAW